MGERLDALPGTELGGDLCRDDAEQRGGVYVQKKFNLKLVHKHIANTALQTINRSLRHAGSVQEHCVWKYIGPPEQKDRATNTVRSLIIAFLKMIKSGGLAGGEYCSKCGETKIYIKMLVQKPKGE